MSALLKSGIDGRALKIKFGELVEAAGRLEGAANFCRASKSMLARYKSLDSAHAKCFAPIDVIRDLERLVGDPIVTRYMAAEAGHGLIAGARLDHVSVADIHAAIASCARGNGEVLSATLTAVADGRVTGKEAGELIPSIRDSIQAKLVLLALVQAAAEVDA